MTMVPRINLSFDGRCEAAFRHYEKCLGGEVLFMLPWGDSPMAADAPQDWRDRIIHASIRIGDAEISGSDAPPHQYEPPKGFEIALNMDEIDAAERTFQLLAENGHIKMPLQETFWAQRFGIVVDQFGVPWAINCGRPLENRPD